MEPIGGYFELEINPNGNHPKHFDKAVWLNTARNAFEFILSSKQEIGTVWLPAYTCEVMLQPIKRLGLSYKFYRINQQLEIAKISDLMPNDVVVVNNYFGIKDKYVERIALEIGKDQVIIDNSQALFHEVPDGIDAFYSLRKFVGVPDGGLAICNKSVYLEEKDESWSRCLHMLKRLDKGAEFGFQDYQKAETWLDERPMKQISHLTKSLISTIDFDSVKRRRICNYEYLRSSLEDVNLLSTPNSEKVACPMTYPFFSKRGTDIRKRLLAKKIFVAQYWPNIKDWCVQEDFEYQFSMDFLPLPIDQRYSEKEMEAIINIVKGK